MAKLKGELQADNGDLLYPHTSSDVVFDENGKTIKEHINTLSGNKADKSNTVRTNANNTHLYTTALEWGKNNPNTISTYAGSGYTDLPPEFKSGWWGEIWTVTGSGTTVFIKENQGEKLWYRVINPSGEWVGGWKLIASDSTSMSYIWSASKEVLADCNYRKPYTTTVTSYTAEYLGLTFEYYNLIYQPNVDKNGYGTQIAIQFRSGRVFTRVSDGMVWGKWKELALTDKTYISFPYNSGFWDYDSNYMTVLSRNSFGEVTLNLYVAGASNVFNATQKIIGILPVGWRPKVVVEANGRAGTEPRCASNLMISKNGEVSVSTLGGSANWISASIVFDTI